MKSKKKNKNANYYNLSLDNSKNKIRFLNKKLIKFSLKKIKILT